MRIQLILAFVTVQILSHVLFQVQADASHSQNFAPIIVPGAVCGNGDPYYVFIRPGDPRKLAFGFMHGGACWSKGSCVGLFAKTRLNEKNEPPLEEGLLSPDPRISALADYTHVYFTYCTGDVYLGNHVGTYGSDTKIYHVGKHNIERSLEHLRGHGIINLALAQQTVLYGFSAGSLGALAHAPTFDRYLPRRTQRTIISDSPGLHFGHEFWNKFPAPLLSDFKTHLSLLGMNVSPANGNLAPQIINFCRSYPHWMVGILQSTKDFVMSRIYGDITGKDMRKMLLSPEGLPALTSYPEDNCAAWIRESRGHVFLNRNKKSFLTAEGKHAIQFANDLILRTAVPRNYLDVYEFPGN